MTERRASGSGATSAGERTPLTWLCGSGEGRPEGIVLQLFEARQVNEDACQRPGRADGDEYLEPAVIVLPVGKANLRLRVGSAGLYAMYVRSLHGSVDAVEPCGCVTAGLVERTVPVLRQPADTLAVILAAPGWANIVNLAVATEVVKSSSGV